MLSFIGGLVIGGIIAIFVYRNNQKQISKYADEIDELYDKIKFREKEIDSVTAEKNKNAEIIKVMKTEQEQAKASVKEVPVKNINSTPKKRGRKPKTTK